MAAQLNSSISDRIFPILLLLAAICHGCPKNGADVDLTTDCSTQTSNLLSINVTCKALGEYVIWDGDIFIQEVTVTIYAPVQEQFRLNIPGVNVNESLTIFESNCIHSTLTFTGRNLSAITDSAINCRTEEEPDTDNIILPQHVEMIQKIAAYAYSSQNCTKNLNDTVIVNVTESDGTYTTRYEVVPSEKFICPDDNCTVSANNATIVGPCNNTYFVSVEARSCFEFELRYIPKTASQVIYTGNSFSYKYVLIAEPSVSNFNWTRNGMPYDGNVTADSIYISVTTLNDTGVYTVTTTNDMDYTSAFFNLTVLCIPEFQLHPSIIYLTEGDYFTISCNITTSCDLPITVTLAVKGEENPLDGNTLNLTNGLEKMLQFSTVKYSGNYTCTAATVQDTSTIVYQIEVNSLPPSSLSSGQITGVVLGSCVLIVAGISFIIILILAARAKHNSGKHTITESNNSKTTDARTEPLLTNS